MQLERACEPLQEREIGELVNAYARAAANALALRFDGIELHAAHGYLIDQFFWVAAGLFSRESAANAGVERITAMVERGEVDFVAVGRALLVDSARAEKLRAGRYDEVQPFTPGALAVLR